MKIKNSTAALNEKFKVWWSEYGYRFKPETDDEKDWCIVVRYWAWKAYEEAHTEKLSQKER